MMQSIGRPIGVKVTNSKHIAGLVGPTLIAMTISESEFLQPHLYDTQIAPVVYLSGTLLFVAGLAIVRVHNCWIGDWTVLVTLIGWFAIFGGLFRMFATKHYQQGAQNTTALLVVLKRFGAKNSLKPIQGWRFTLNAQKCPKPIQSSKTCRSKSNPCRAIIRAYFSTEKC
jgi:hypothetical protein